MKNYEEWKKYKQVEDVSNPFSTKYVTQNDDEFYIEPVFYTMLSSFKEHHPKKIEDILQEMDRVVKVNHKVVFTGNYEHPLTINIDDYVILEIFDITNKLKIFVEDKSRGSDYGD